MLYTLNRHRHGERVDLGDPVGEMPVPVMQGGELAAHLDHALAVGAYLRLDETFPIRLQHIGEPVERRASVLRFQAAPALVESGIGGFDRGVDVFRRPAGDARPWPAIGGVDAVEHAVAGGTPAPVHEVRIVPQFHVCLLQWPVPAERYHPYGFRVRCGRRGRLTRCRRPQHSLPESASDRGPKPLN